MPKRIVSTDFWTDDKVIDFFTPEDKYFMLYLLTNPHSAQLGIYHLSPKVAAFEMGYSVEAVKTLLERFENKYKMIKWNNDTQEVAIKNYLKYSIIKGGKPMYDLLTQELAKVKDWNLVEYIVQELNSYTNLNATVRDFINTNIVNNKDNVIVNVIVNSSANRDTNRPTNRQDDNNELLGKVLDFWNINFHPIVAFEVEELSALYEEVGYSNIMEAMAEAVAGGTAKKNLKYVRTVARNIVNGVNFKEKKQKPIDVPPEIVKQFKDWMSGNRSDLEMTEMQGKAISAVGYQAIMMRKAGTDQEFLDKIVAKYAELVGGQK